MMMEFEGRAEYLRYYLSIIALAITKAGADAQFRADEDPRIQALADSAIAPLITPDANGKVKIIIGVLGVDQSIFAPVAEPQPGAKLARALRVMP